MKAIPVALLLLVLVAAAASFQDLTVAADNGGAVPDGVCDGKCRKPVLAEEGRAVHGPVHDVLRQVPGLRAVGPVRQQGRVPLLQGHEVPQDPAPQVPLG
ncbi:unnamed protein product [Miscanthus lutarioriparius]|uniref:Uncharacterized protein n=1 Tax=Miscanthus lutarioriparius TaxID=422564 RepID=A0A811NFF9_9POAL|nr:unnamed protein product [Miscanthus lutarioriparius]